MDKQTKEIKKSIEEHQCSGCVGGSDINCGKFKQDKSMNCACVRHTVGTMSPGVGHFLPGMPKGFCRTTVTTDSPFQMECDTLDEYLDGDKDFDVFNRPLQKWLNEKGHTEVIVLCPRVNHIVRLVIKEDCIDRIKCRKLYIQDMLFKYDVHQKVDFKIFKEFPSPYYSRGTRFAWKHLNKEGYTFVRGLDFFNKQLFIHIILENCMDEINCFEVTEKVINSMD